MKIIKKILLMIMIEILLIYLTYLYVNKKYEVLIFNKNMNSIELNHNIILLKPSMDHMIPLNSNQTIKNKSQVIEDLINDL